MFSSYRPQIYQKYIENVTEQQQNPPPFPPLLRGLLILCFHSALASISVNRWIAFEMVLAVLFSLLFWGFIRLICFYWVWFCACSPFWCLVKSCFHPHCSCYRDHYVSFTDLQRMGDVGQLCKHWDAGMTFIWFWFCLGSAFLSPLQSELLILLMYSLI